MGDLGDIVDPKGMSVPEEIKVFINDKEFIGRATQLQDETIIDLPREAWEEFRKGIQGPPITIKMPPMPCCGGPFPCEESWFKENNEKADM